MPPLVISGPSGSGKTFLLNFLVNNYKFQNVLSTMTRARRFKEKNLVDNEYVTISDYEKIRRSGDFFMDNEFLGNLYGYRRSFINKIQESGKIPVAIVFTPIIDQFLKEYPHSNTIYLLPTNFDLIKKRMRKRGESEIEITKRIESAKKEISSFEANKKFYKNTFEITTDDDVFKVIEYIKEIYSLM